MRASYRSLILAVASLFSVGIARAQFVTVETKPIKMDAVQFHDQYVKVKVVLPPPNSNVFPYDYLIPSAGFEGKLPEQVLNHIFTFTLGDKSHLGIWCNGMNPRGNFYPTIGLHDGDWIIVDGESTWVYSQAEFEKRFLDPKLN